VVVDISQPERPEQVPDVHKSCRISTQTALAPIMLVAPFKPGLWAKEFRTASVAQGQGGPRRKKKEYKRERPWSM
jgi:hypothetical protein